MDILFLRINSQQLYIVYGMYLVDIQIYHLAEIYWFNSTSIEFKWTFI